MTGSDVARAQRDVGSADTVARAQRDVGSADTVARAQRDVSATGTVARAQRDVGAMQPIAATGRSVTRASQGPIVPPLDPPPVPQRSAPQRPTLGDQAHPPVLVKLPPPFTVRMTQLSWILSFAVAASAVVYLFIIRKAQLPDIAALVKTVDGSRAEGTYESAADIVFWTAFGGVVAVLLVQIALLVAFSNRRPGVRWWQLGSLFLQGIVLVFARELVAIGDRGRPAELLLLVALGLALIALAFSVLRPALRWTARKHDVRRGPAT